MADKATNTGRKKSRRGHLILALVLATVVLAGILALTLEVQGSAHGYGHITAQADPLLRARQKGPIAEILAQQDQQVSTGQIIIRLDDALARVNLERAHKAALEANIEIQVFQAQCTLAQARRTYEQGRVKLQLESARTKLQQLTEGQARGTVSAMELAEAQLAYDIMAHQPHEVYQAEVELEKQQLTLLNGKAQAAQAQVSLCQEQLASLDVRSPTDGRLVLNPLVVGEVVDANKVLGRVFDESSFTVQAKFPERLLYLLKEGQPAQITPAGRSRWDQPLTGKLAKVSRLIQPQESGDGYFWVTVEIDSTDLRLYPGQDAQITVLLGKVRLFRSILGL